MLKPVRRVVRASVGVLVLVAVACGDDSGEQDAGANAGGAGSGAAGASATSAGRGGRDGDAAPGGNAGANGSAGRDGGATPPAAGQDASAAGAGGDAAGDGGSDAAGDGGSDGGAGSAGTGIDDVDLTLGGFNQDLPAPTGDCVSADVPTAGCLSVSGELNGEMVDFDCFDSYGPIRVAMSPRDLARSFGCGMENGPDVGVKLGAPLFEGLPVAFEVHATEEADRSSYVRVGHGDLETYVDGMFQSGSSHTIESRIAGELTYGEGVNPQNTSELARGTYAVSFLPKAGCVPDGEGRGCDIMRFRGSFFIRTRPVVTPAP